MKNTNYNKLNLNYIIIIIFIFIYLLLILPSHLSAANKGYIITKDNETYIKGVETPLTWQNKISITSHKAKIENDKDQSNILIICNLDEVYINLC